MQSGIFDWRMGRITGVVVSLIFIGCMEQQESSNKKDLQEINELTSQFFDLFTNTNGKTPQLNKINTLFIKEGMIINNTSGEPLIYNLDSFIKPRDAMLSDGTLVDFRESEMSH